MWHKFVYILNYLKFLRQCLKTIHRRTQLNKIKKVVLMTAAYFKVSTPPMSAETIIMLRLPSFTKMVVSCIKQKKNTTIEFCISALV